MQKFLIRSLFLVLLLSAAESWALRPCPGSYDNNTWTNCEGTYTWPSGSNYVGEWKDDKYHGQGTALVDGNKYVGEWEDGKQHGQGTLTYANGDKYVGGYKDDKRQGQGTYTFADGRKYVGGYKDDKYHGQGTFTYGPDSQWGGDIYVGEWKDDKPHGQGTHTFANGDKYVGEWKDDKQHGQGTNTYANGDQYVGEWKEGDPHGRGTHIFATGDRYVGENEDGLPNGQGTYTYVGGMRYVGEFRAGTFHGDGVFTDVDGRVKEGLWEHNKFLSVRKTKYRGSHIVSDTTPGVSSTKDLAGATAAKREADSERRKREELERKLSVLEAERQKEKQRIGSDTEAPKLNIVFAETEGKRGVIRGIATDNTGVAEVTVDGQAVAVDQAGQFKHTTFIPPSGIEVTVQVMDLAGLQSSETVKLERDASRGPAALSFDRLNPLKGKVQKNTNALALIVGIAKYGKTTADAVYADKDALMFRDYAALKLGVPEGRIKVLVNDAATEADVLLGVKDWLGRSSKPGQSDVYVFFAGHGLASADGEQMYLLPDDGRPRLLDKTAILRDELFADIEAINPRSVTVFLDTCYSGTTRGTEMLMASRPIGLRVLQQSIPAGFTVFSAAAGNEISKPLTEAEHGLFSYFVMKGMEGEADGNADRQITAHELQAYVRRHVVQQSSGSQTPELQGDKDRVLVRFQ